MDTEGGLCLGPSSYLVSCTQLADYENVAFISDIYESSGFYEESVPSPLCSLYLVLD